RNALVRHHRRQGHRLPRATEEEAALRQGDVAGADVVLTSGDAAGTGHRLEPELRRPGAGEAAASSGALARAVAQLPGRALRLLPRWIALLAAIQEAIAAERALA